MHTSDTPALRDWIKTESARGCTPQSLEEAMIKSGYAPDFSAQIIAKMLCLSDNPQAALYSDPSAAVQTDQSSSLSMPGPNISNGESTLFVGDKYVRVLTSIRHPRIVVLEGVLSIDECDELIELARPRLSKSLTVDRDTGDSVEHKARVSEGMFFQQMENSLIERIEKRISHVLQWPIEHGEGLQVLHYLPGGQYEPHNDYFDPKDTGSAVHLQRGGQRLGTLILYLNTPKQGGSTSFPETGVQVAAIKGNAVFFSYATPTPDTLTLHGGDPVISGEKWIATKWLRQGVFT